MVALLSASGVMAEMHTIKDAGHIEALFDRETMTMAMAFADKHLKGGSSIEEKRAGPSPAPSVNAKSGASDAQ
jgi:hypothetical protein